MGDGAMLPLLHRRPSAATSFSMGCGVLAGMKTDDSIEGSVTSDSLRAVDNDDVGGTGPLR